MKVRNVALAIATLAVLVPAISNASAEKAALNACAREFASRLASPGNAVPAFKVTYLDNRSSGSMFDFYDRVYLFDLHANNEKTGTPIARASCTTDTHGAV